MAKFAVVLPAAGQSSRFAGKEKKPFTQLDGRAVWIRSVEAFVNRPDVVQIILVISPEDRELFTSRFAANVMFMNIHLVDGGKERFESIANGLAKLDPEVEFVAVHDAVRPCVPAALIDQVFAMAEKTGAALPGLPINETIKEVNQQQLITKTVAREQLWAVQTPQVFRKELLLEAYANRGNISGKITDDAQLVEALGQPVTVVPGSHYNIKITTKADLNLAGWYIKAKEAEDKPKVIRAFDDERFS
ncbi:MAG: 2-C-methyl-D-erythritol 4-phosphate cytidylyltransferase [Zavarzinella sp.]